MTEQRTVYPDSPFHAIAWRDCLLWAIQDPDRLEEFTAETGIAFPATQRNGLDAMIDAATGHREAAIHRFIAWFNEHIWGADPYVSGIPTFPEATEDEAP